MSYVEAVTIAMIASAFFFVYVAFSLYRSDKWWMNLLGELFFIISLVFVNGIMWTASQIAENNTLTYLTTGLVPFINISFWTLTIVIMVLFIKLVYVMMYAIKAAITNNADASEERERGSLSGGDE